MASVTTDPNGNRTVQFVGADRKRRSVRLGKVSKKAAEAVKARVEHLNAAAVAKLAWDADLAAWAAGVGDDMADKLAAVGLVPRRQTATLKAFLADFQDRHRHEWSAGTRVQVGQRAGNLVEAFGDRELRAVTADAAAGFVKGMHEQGLAGPTIHRRVRSYKAFFAEAVERKLIGSNPFETVYAPEGDVSRRRQYVPAGDALALIDRANACWRTVIALSRFAGLRCPSEVLSLKLAEVDLSAGRMLVDSSKTGRRVVPVLATLRPYIEEAVATAGQNAVHVVHGDQADHYRATADTERGWVATNLRSTFLKLIKRCELEAWPRPFHNMRSSCETDLCAEFPAHVVAKWMGHSLAVAEKHYLQVRDADLDRAAGYELPAEQAVQNPVQSGAVRKRPGAAGKKAGSEKTLELRLLTFPDGTCQDVQVTRQGFEP